MKYFKYIAIVLFTLFRKIFGKIWFWAVTPWDILRDWSRNTVYNYKLQNHLWLKRLYEREVVCTSDGYWRIYDKSGKPTGCIKKRSVSKFEYLLAYWFVWGWIDDDSNYDTMDLGYLLSYRPGGEREGSWIYKVFNSQIEYAINKMQNAKFGNTFDLGDNRATNPLFSVVGSYMWCLRNTAYNFKYDQYETTNLDDVFYFELFGKGFGWIPEGVVDDEQNYTLVFWE